MAELDQVYRSFDKEKKEYNKEEYIQFKRKEKEELYELIDKMAVNTMQNEDELKKYLNIQSRFNQYSVGNALAITFQMPEATLLKDFEGWSNIGGFPKKYRKNVKILEPVDLYMREDGSVGKNYNVKYVCDISQVSIKAKAPIIKYDDKLLLMAFLKSYQGEIKIIDENQELNRKAVLNKKENVLYIIRGSESPYIFYDLSEELIKQQIEENNLIDSFKIKCASYMLCKKYGIDIEEYDKIEIPYEFKEMSGKQIREELEVIRDAFGDINNRISYAIETITKQNKQKNQVK